MLECLSLCLFLKTKVDILLYCVFFCQQNDSARLNVITSFTNLLIQFFTSCINLIVYTNHLGKRI